MSVLYSLITVQLSLDGHKAWFSRFSEGSSSSPRMHAHTNERALLEGIYWSNGKLIRWWSATISDLFCSSLGDGTTQSIHSVAHYWRWGWWNIVAFSICQLVLVSVLGRDSSKQRHFPDEHALVKLCVSSSRNNYSSFGTWKRSDWYSEWSMKRDEW